MATVPTKNAKAIIQDEKDAKEPIESPTSVITTNSLNAPKHGTVIPNRVFVGGICSATTEAELMTLFSNYGTVIGAKIIADRAGVSKGYGFVTFETEEEAKRLQKDANNIILRERRLNIAPAIKKQGYGRGPSYDCSPTTPIPMPSQVFRQNGVPYTFHNGMAFFPQPQPQPITPQHMEPPTIYQQGTHYSTVPQGSPAPTYQYAYSQGQLIYQTAPQYQCHIPQYEGCYDPQVVMHEGNLVVPQYYIASQPGHETYAYYPTTPMHPQEPSHSLQHSIMYPSPRGYDSAILYPQESSTQSDASVVQVQEADTSAANAMTTPPNVPSNNEITTTTANITENSNRRGRETPVVSLLKVQQQQQYQPSYHNYKEGSNIYTKGSNGQSYNTIRRKPRQFEEQRRPVHLNNNNNSPDMANRNLMGYCPPQRGSRRGSGASGEGADQPPPPPNPYQTNNPPPPRPSVPTFPFYRHPPAFYPPPPHRTRSFFQKPTRFMGPVSRGGRGYHQQYQSAGPHYRPVEGGAKWNSPKEEDGGSRPLTPPITPKSEAGRAATPAQPEELAKAMQAVTI